MIKIDVEASPTFMRLCNWNCEDTLSDVLDDLIYETFWQITIPGIGTRGHNPFPSGGAPEDTGALIRSHDLDRNSKLEKKITVGVDYAENVINGTSSQYPNNYPQRAADEYLNQAQLEEAVNNVVKEAILYG